MLPNDGFGSNFGHTQLFGQSVKDEIDAMNYKFNYFSLILIIFTLLFFPFHNSYGEDGGFTQKDRELLIQLNVRVNELEKRTDDRFIAMDKSMSDRFEAMNKSINARFEAMDKNMNNRFEAMDKNMNDRFGEMDKRMADQTSQFDKRMADLISIFIAIVASFAGIVAVTISFAVWDRRTMVKPFENKVKKAEEEIINNRSQIKKLIKVLRKIAPSNPQVAEALRAFSLL